METQNKQNKARPLEVLVEMGRVLGRTAIRTAVGIGKATAKATIKATGKIAYLTSTPFLIPTNYRKAADNKANFIKSDYYKRGATLGVIIDMFACSIPLLMIDTNPKLAYAPATIIGANTLSGIYETVRHAYKRTEMRLNAKVKGDSKQNERKT